MTDSSIQTIRIDINGEDVSYRCRGGDTLLGSALRARIGFPYECGVGGCGSCKFELMEGALQSDREDAPGLRPSDIRKNKHLACISFPRSDCRIKIKCDPAYRPAIRPARRRLRLVQRAPLTPDLWEFQFESQGPAEFLPGQYAKFSIPGVKGARSYSMANLANPDGHWQFQIKRAHGGEATVALFDRLQYGDTIEIDAPYSIAHLRHPSRRTVCIAGGSGLAPMVSIIRGLGAGAQGANNVVLYYGARRPTEIVDPGIFADVDGFDAASQYRPVVSDATGGEDWTGPTGLVHEFMAQDLTQDCSDTEFYIAGPPPMVDAVRRHLVLERQIPVGHIHYDRFY